METLRERIQWISRAFFKVGGMRTPEVIEKRNENEH